MQANEVLRILEEAWKDVGYPGDDRIASKSAGCNDEYAWIAEFFKGKHWTEITLKRLREQDAGALDSCLAFLTTEALHYFLPSFLQIALFEYDPSDEVTAGTISMLCPPTFDEKLYEMAKLPGMTDATNPCSRQNVEGRHGWWEQRVQGFTPAQRRAIVVFLEYMDCQHGHDYAYSTAGPKVALAYWKEAAGKQSTDR
jgi:hypothetical protein